MSTSIGQGARSDKVQMVGNYFNVSQWKADAIHAHLAQNHGSISISYVARLQKDIECWDAPGVGHLRTFICSVI